MTSDGSNRTADRGDECADAQARHPVLHLIAPVTLGGSGLCHELSEPSDYPSIDTIRKAGCVPKDDTARILQSAHPNDLVPLWSKHNYVGTGWTFLPKRYEETELDGGIFLQGDLISTRGAVVSRDVFIL